MENIILTDTEIRDIPAIGSCYYCKTYLKLRRIYFRYEDVKCDCHSPYHFDLYDYCYNCEAIQPETTDISGIKYKVITKAEHRKNQINSILMEQNMSKYIDYTLLKQGMTINEVENLCKEAIKYNVASVCIPSMFVYETAEFLKGTDIKVCTVIGFPYGYASIASKCIEIEEAIEDGAQEIDIVQNISLIKSGNFSELNRELSFLKMANFTNIRIKMILETGLLSEEEIIKCCEIYDGKVEFVKTSTGFANEPHKGEEFKTHKINCVKLMKLNFSGEVKASGGIRDVDFAMQLIEAGATRLGCSSFTLLEELSKINVI